MSKTVQVKLKIEEFFDGLFIVQIAEPYEPSYLSLIDNIYTVIGTKIQKDSFETDNLSAHVLKDGETRDSVIKSLWELQESLLPKGYDLNDIAKYLTCPIYIMKHRDNEHKIEANFYDPATRIVCITKFEEDCGE